MIANPGRTSQNRGRDRNDSRFRQAQEAKPKDTYYRPEYGWVMSNKMVEQEKGVKAKYDQAVAQGADQVKQNEQQFQGLLEQKRNEINSAYSKQANQYNPQLVPVRVVNKDKVEATYMLPKETVDGMGGSFNKGDGSYYANWVDGGKYYNIDVNVKGGGARGHELHTSLQQAVAQNNAARDTALANLNKEKSATLKSFEQTAAKEYDGAKAVWEKELETLRGAYAKRVATGKQQYEEGKEKYSQSVIGVNDGLLQSPTQQVNANAQNANAKEPW